MLQTLDMSVGAEFQIVLGVPAAQGGHAFQQRFALGVQVVQQYVPGDAPAVQDQRPVQKLLHIVQIVGAKQDRFLAVERAAHQLDAVPAGEGVLAQKRLVHQVVGGPPAEARGQFHPRALPGGKLPDHTGPVQREKL